MKQTVFSRDSEMLALVFYGDYELAAYLLAHEFEATATEADAIEGENGDSLLHWAVQEGHTNIVHLLLQRGADPEALGQSSITPFSAAAAAGNLRFLKIMRHYGARANGVAGANVPLIIAVAWKRSKCVRYLLRHGADVNAQDKKGSTALLLAVHHGHHGMASLLLKHGARTDIRDEDGALLWELEEENKTPKTTRDTKLSGGLTLWEMAEENGDAQMLRLLDSGLGRANTGRPIFDR